MPSQIIRINQAWQVNSQQSRHRTSLAPTVWQVTQIILPLVNDCVLITITWVWSSPLQRSSRWCRWLENEPATHPEQWGCSLGLLCAPGLSWNYKQMVVMQEWFSVLILDFPCPRYIYFHFIKSEPVCKEQWKSELFHYYLSNQ